MRWTTLALVVMAACGSKDESPPAPTPPAAPAAAVTPAAHKPPDEMDEKMRHCPLAINGASTTLTDTEGGVQFEIRSPAPMTAEVQRRAHHVVEFAAGRAPNGTHGAFDGKGGQRMKNCPVVTNGVAISVEDLADGARIKVTAADGRVAELRAETRQRATRFPYTGATVVIR